VSSRKPSRVESPRWLHSITTRCARTAGRELKRVPQ